MFMNISAINNGYHVATKSTQYDTTYPPVSITPDESYMEEESSNTSSMLPLIVAGAIALGGLGFGIYKHREVGDLAKKLSEKTKELETTKKTLDETKNNLTNVENAKKSVENELQKLKDAAKNTPKDEAKKPNIFKRFWNFIKRSKKEA